MRIKEKWATELLEATESRGYCPVMALSATCTLCCSLELFWVTIYCKKFNAQRKEKAHLKKEQGAHLWLQTSAAINLEQYLNLVNHSFFYVLTTLKHV